MRRHGLTYRYSCSLLRMLLFDLPDGGRTSLAVVKFFLVPLPDELRRCVDELDFDA